MAGNQVPFNQLAAPENKYGADGSGLPSYQNNFIQKFAPYAMLAASQTGIPARFLLAEASIETDWGRSGSATKFNNIFGIRPGGGHAIDQAASSARRTASGSRRITMR
ncbi:glucosaminidase domain-containing protein [Methylobacterium sp. E-016]|uniref:glucosaminidase domain-containing protein n=1 Tax=Methylobacterium sp. E-016 TaxID=2836556 RepID=UPI001FBA1DD8|nr:glucosaminidase domain-containing protein [Methylobacterium sp. E-016]MCJ2074790.1 glucosaminidase domain-containing protein [Methylobacterium sp. E-016]